MLLDEDKQSICDYYEIDPVNKWSQNNQGLVNITYELDDEYFLTIHAQKIREQVEAIGIIANEMENSIPITKPAKGKNGYSLKLNDGYTLLNPRLQGMHYVGIAHTNKYPIPLELHRSFAKFFWELQVKLSAVSQEIKKVLEASSVMNTGTFPPQIPNMAHPLMKYSKGENNADFKYKDLIHDDMERQNILSIDNEITGLVDLDSLRSGDILYEFGHFLFNFVLCDPDADLTIIELYINEVIKAGIIKPKDLPSLYRCIFQFAISDIFEFERLSLNQTLKQHKDINLKLLVKQYDVALSLAAEFFRVEFAL